MVYLTWLVTAYQHKVQSSKSWRSWAGRIHVHERVVRAHDQRSSRLSTQTWNKKRAIPRQFENHNAGERLAAAAKDREGVRHSKDSTLNILIAFRRRRFPTAGMEKREKRMCTLLLEACAPDKLLTDIMDFRCGSCGFQRRPDASDQSNYDALHHGGSVPSMLEHAITCLARHVKLMVLSCQVPHARPTNIP